MQRKVESQDLDLIGDLVLSGLSGEVPVVGKNLSNIQDKELEQIVQEFLDVFSAKPREAKGVEHQIKTLSRCIVRNHWTHLLRLLWQSVGREIDQIKQLQIIEESCSPWRS